MNGLAERLNRRAIIWGDHTAESETGRCAIEISQLGGAGSALGAALLAGMHSGVYPGPRELARKWRCSARFEPAMDAVTRTALLDRWRTALQRTLYNG